MKNLVQVRAAAGSDVPVLVELLEAYMRETFQRPWHGSAEALARDGFGAELEVLVACTASGAVVGFAAWSKAYDLHHCLTGGSILDMYVVPEHRCRGVAVLLAFSLAAEVRRRGGSYIKGQAVDQRGMQRMYARVAVCFPGADCFVGGRAFRQLADLADAPLRVAARSLPDRAWNHEP